MKYLQLLRWKNLAMIIYIFVLIKYFFLSTLSIPSFLNDFQFALFVLSIVLISGAGYVINDIYDIGIDKINKPNKVIVNKLISKEKAYNLYTYLNIAGLAIGFYLSYLIDHINFAFVYVASSLLLYQYAISLKKMFIVGNIVISLLAGISIFIIVLYDLLPAITDENGELIYQAFKIISVYAIFAFVITLIREIVKDIEDIDGDRKFGVKSLALEIGISRTKKIVSILSLFPLIAIFYYSMNYLAQQSYSLAYIFIFIELPLLYFTIKINLANNKSDFKKLSTLLKLIMFTGISSIFVFTLIFKLNYSF
ncbi:MAG: geranylgeranylglycerol-phosphate geranylgeranyltransferase [Flavobacteriales bacterium]|nr:geranylgeranylglycerol-phosphate geranylgeranyltransferase [Flavobacteriales bacterium]